jgi:hypothetical protein
LACDANDHTYVVCCVKTADEAKSELWEELNKHQADLIARESQSLSALLARSTTLPPCSHRSFFALSSFFVLRSFVSFHVSVPG